MVITSETRILDYLPYAAFILDGDWQILYANQSAETLLAASARPRKKGSNDRFSIAMQSQLNSARATMEYNKLSTLEFESETILGNNQRTLRFKLVSLNDDADNDESANIYLMLAHDITEEHVLADTLTKLNNFDILTGVYNRNYFETVANYYNGLPGHLPYGLVLCDVDGLKVVNDCFGHLAGDSLLKTFAGILKDCFPTDAIIARIGGDEFCVLLKDCEETVLKAYVEITRRRISESKLQHIKLSVSIGYAISTTAPYDIFELFKEADNYMYRHKLHRTLSNRSGGISLANQLLAERDFMTQGHGKRLEKLVSLLAEKIGLSEKAILELRLLACFHDIGKIGISDSILLKPGPLTRKERLEMQRHCEIGYRIAIYSGDLSPIADWIFKHHEKWDGTGYPLGLSAENIPLECRILAIADAYDAMTNDRPYRKAMSCEKAVGELKQYAGSQFDPELVELFLGLISAQVF